MRFSKLIILAGICAALGLSYYFGLFDGISLEELRKRHQELRSNAAMSPFLYRGGFFLLYVSVTALSLPGAAVLTLAAGAIFGFWQGLLLASFASTMGATFAFLLSRYLLKDWVEKKFGAKFIQVRNGFERDGASYLVFLRLVPAFPFFIVNIVTGLTKISVVMFYLVSQIAMLPGTAIFVNAGTELARVQEISDILSARLVIAFCLLGVFPILAKKSMEVWRRRNVG